MSVFFGNDVPFHLLVRQNLIHRRPPEVAVGDLLRVVQSEGDLANIPRINGCPVPGRNPVEESGPPIDEVLGRFPARRAGGCVDLGRDPPVEVVVGKGDGLRHGPGGIFLNVTQVRRLRWSQVYSTQPDVSTFRN